MAMTFLNARERGLLFAFAAFGVLALAGPAVSLPAIDRFADDRAWLGLPNAMNVLSNLPFALLGAWGLRWLYLMERGAEESQQQSAFLGAAHRLDLSRNPCAVDCAWLFFAGLMFTAAGSALYHYQPDDLRLVADRAGMAVAFAGMIGLAVCDRVSERAGWLAAWLSLVAGLAAVGSWHWSGDVLPWSIVQFGGMALLLVLWRLDPVPEALGLKLGRVLFFYALAKLFELADAEILGATHQLVSGHTLKHLTASLAAWPVLQAIGAFGRSGLRHNPGAARLTA
ncbi:conserved membrane hypothetical protein [Burkholderiales bacterium 8X]|nr:conserved membrane hypothetical protein [Burkholderiales bacterium 8X]